MKETDVDGYPKRCFVCGRPVLAKEGGVFLTALYPSGKTKTKTARHLNCRA